jgi:hypothetical protein
MILRDVCDYLIAHVWLSNCVLLFMPQLVAFLKLNTFFALAQKVDLLCGYIVVYVDLMLEEVWPNLY